MDHDSIHYVESFVMITEIFLFYVDLLVKREADFWSSDGMWLAHGPFSSTGPGRITLTLTSSHTSRICNHGERTRILNNVYNT